jgi:hypothetical protein
MKRTSTPSQYAIGSTYRLGAEMRVTGLIMICLAVAMFVLARPRRGAVVHWLRSENRQWAYVMTIVLLTGVGFAVSLAG